MTTKTLARLAALAYRNGDEPEVRWRMRLERELGRMGFHLVDTFDAVDTQAFVAECTGDIVIVFRGTEPDRATDAWTDCQFWPREDLLGTVHSGFSKALDRVWFPVLASIDDYRGGNSRFWCTGHSMGGAMALIAASRLLRSHHICGVTTFGAPASVSRFVSRIIEKMLNGKAVRVERADVVTMLLRLLYRPTGNRLYITRHGRVIERAGWHVAFADRAAIAAGGLVSRARALWRGRWRELFACPHFVANHSMDGYVIALGDEVNATME